MKNSISFAKKQFKTGRNNTEFMLEGQLQNRFQFIGRIILSTIDHSIFLEYKKKELSKPNKPFECAVMCMNIHLTTKNLDFTKFQTVN